MTRGRFTVVGVKTSQREWFALSIKDASLSDAGLEPSIGRSEAEMRKQLRDLGLSEGDIDERFKAARRWMASVTAGATSTN